VVIGDSQFQFVWFFAGFGVADANDFWLAIGLLGNRKESEEMSKNLKEVVKFGKVCNSFKKINGD